MLERTFERAYLKVLEQTVQIKAEELFRQALSPGSPVAQKPQEKMEQGFQRFLKDRIRWDRKKAGFKK